MSPLIIPLLLLLLAAVGLAVWWFLIRPLIKGIPRPTGVDCVAGKIVGEMNPSNSERPVSFFAFIWDNDATDPTGIPKSQWETWTCNHTWTGGINTTDFELTSVSKNDVLSGTVRVAVWCTFSDGTDAGPGHAVLNCGGSGSGNAELLARRSGEVVPQAVTDTGPLQCTVDVSGFAPSALAVFNRAWKLVHRSDCCGGLTWDNGHDGTAEPRVELTTQKTFGTPWRLTFRLGEIVVSYTKPAEEWRALAANTFQSCTSTGLEHDAAVPAAVTVVPA